MKAVETRTETNTYTYDVEFSNGFAIRLEYDDFPVDSPLEDEGFAIKAIIDLGNRRGGLQTSNNGGFEELYQEVKKIEEQPEIAKKLIGKNSPIDSQYCINKDGEYILDKDGYYIDNPRHVDYYDFEAGSDSIKNLLTAAKKYNFFMTEIYFYDHGGVCYSINPFSDPWDSGCNGIVWASPAMLAAAGINEEQAEKQAKCLMDNMTDYANGNVFVACVAPAEYDAENDELVITGEWDYCGGFLGREWAMQYAREEMATA